MTISVDPMAWALSTLGQCSAQARAVWWEMAIRHATGATMPADPEAAARLYRVDLVVYSAALDELQGAGLYPLDDAPAIVTAAPVDTVERDELQRRRESSRERARRCRERSATGFDHDSPRSATSSATDSRRGATSRVTSSATDSPRSATGSATQGGVGGGSAPSLSFPIPKSIQPPPASSGGRAEKTAAAALGSETESQRTLKLAGVSDPGTLARLADTPPSVVRAAIAKANKRKGGPGGPGLIVAIIDAGDCKPDPGNPAHDTAREHMASLSPNHRTDVVNSYREFYRNVPGMERASESKIIESRAFLDWLAAGLSSQRRVAP